jgi:hypothetical protein
MQKFETIRKPLLGEFRWGSFYLLLFFFFLWPCESKVNSQDSPGVGVWQFRWRRWGSAHARTSARPHIKTSRTHFVQIQTSPSTPQKLYPKFRNPRKTFQKKTLSAKQPHSVGGSVTEFCGGLESYYFCYLGALQNFTTLGQTLLREKNPDRKREEKKMLLLVTTTLMVDTWFCL